MFYTFEDCPNIIEKLRINVYNLDDILAIVEAYNYRDPVLVEKMKKTSLAF